MRPKKFAIPFCLSLLSLACNNRVDADYDYDGDGSEDMSLVRYDLYGVDLSRIRDRDAACASVKAEATLAKKPVDVVFIIDNSGSMTDEIVAVQNNINKNFADIMSRSGLDYRVIMVASHGRATVGQSICVSKPLSSVDCSPTVPPRPGNNPPRFYHYSIEVESTDSFRRALGALNGAIPDQFALAPGGWQTWLRTDAFKVFIEITDDESDMDAAEFDRQLLAKAPMHFGTAANRNYVFHTIAGLKENTPATKAWEPTDPLQGQRCTRGGGAVNAGTKYQQLSILTKGLRFPICEHASFDAVFNNVAAGVIAGAKVACDFPLPPPPAGQQIDLDSVLLEYSPGSGGPPQTFKKVAGPAACMPNAFYLDRDRVYICPDACNTVQADVKAKVGVLFDCLSIIG